MSQPLKHFYRFDEFQIDRSERLLWRGGEIISLTQKAFDLLIALVERRGQVVSKEELMRQVWQGTYIEDGTLTQNIYTLRKVLGKTPAGADYIQTLPRRGYRFTAEVSESSEPGIVIKPSVSALPDGGPATEDDHKLPANPLTTTDATIQLSEPVESADVTQSQRPPEPAPAGAQADKFSHSARLGSRHSGLIIITLVVLLGGLAFGLYKFSGRSEPQKRQLQITNLTNTGNLQGAAISPDGKYVVYAVGDRPQQSSLWLHQLSTHTNEQLLAPVEVRYHAVAFSRDGAYVYYVLDEPDSRVLYRIPMVGGTAKKLIDNVDGTVSFSPDSKQLVFRRVLNERRETALFIAGADGSDEREIAAIKFPETFGDPSWSPDGQVIACAAGRIDGSLSMYVVGVRVADKTLKQISAGRWQWVGQMAWLKDASGLLMVAGERPSAPYQIWRLAYQTGEAQRVTNDANTYNRLSMSADAGVIIALQRRQATNLWLIPAEDTSRARQLTFGTGGYRGALSWTPDGRIVFDSDAGQALNISLMNADGSNARPLLGDMTGRGYVGQAVVSPDGRYIIYSSDVTGVRHLWRMHLDGSNAMQLTNGEGEDHPNCSPDGRWVVYTKLETRESGRPMIEKISIDGGDPQPLTEAFTAFPVVSPDSKLVACVHAENYNDDGKLAIFPIEGGRPLKVFQTKVQMAPPRWVPDGRGLAYAENSINSSKILVQPVAGGEPKPLVEFATDRIFGFDWSPDGKQLACVRGFWSANAVIIKDFTAE